jgi:hypothetical protein
MKGKMKKKKLGSMELKAMIRAIFTSQKRELTCEECFDRLDEFAEVVLKGKPRNEGIALVEDHLEKCMDCREEFELLLKALQQVQRAQE